MIGNKMRTLSAFSRRRLDRISSRSGDYQGSGVDYVTEGRQQEFALRLDESNVHGVRRAYATLESPPAVGRY